MVNRPLRRHNNKHGQPGRGRLQQQSKQQQQQGQQQDQQQQQQRRRRRKWRLFGLILLFVITKSLITTQVQLNSFQWWFQQYWSYFPTYQRDTTTSTHQHGLAQSQSSSKPTVAQQLAQVENSSSSASRNSRTTTINTYHSWDPKGVDFQRILKQLNYSWSGKCRECDHYVQRNRKRLARLYQPFPAFVAVLPSPPPPSNNNNNTTSLPATPIPSLWLSKRITGDTLSANGAYGAYSRFRMTFPRLQEALQQQLVMPQYKHLFPNLLEALNNFGLLPFYIDYGDYRGCPDPKYPPNKFDVLKETVGLPYLSIAKSDKCAFGFPIPTYTTYELAMAYGSTTTNSTNSSNSSPTPWIQQMMEWNRTYPWHNKISKAYWRGGLKNERIELVQKANNNTNDGNTTTPATTTPTTDLFDVQESTLRTLHPKEYSMKYKIVIDLDGNSWSERFPRLLCYNSAVMLIINRKEDYDEYFMKDLIPNVHYIPATIDNFTTVAYNLLTRNDDKDAFLQSIVQNANEFCRERIIPEQLNLDFLSILDGYYSTLYQFNPNWIRDWKKDHPLYVGPGLGHGGFTNGQGEIRQDLLHTTKLLSS